MTMFASVALPDRFPFHVGKVRLAYEGTLGGIPTQLAPRPFDPSMGNTPNPILVEFRRGEIYPKKAEHYLQYLDGDVYDWRDFPPAVFEHARRVLTRLAACS